MAKQKISIRPPEIIDQLAVGDILYVDFDTLVLLITETKTLSHGFLKAKIISSGSLGSNKGIVLDPQIDRKINLPTLSKKDVSAIELGLKNKSFILVVNDSKIDYDKEIICLPTLDEAVEYLYMEELERNV